MNMRYRSGTQGVHVFKGGPISCITFQQVAFDKL